MTKSQRALLCAVLLAGCAAYEGAGPRPLESLPGVELGKTTMKDVREQFGVPVSTGRMLWKDRTWWEYVVTDRMQVDHLYSVYFSGDGIARETGMVRHPKYDIPGSYN